MLAVLCAHPRKYREHNPYMTSSLLKWSTQEFCECPTPTIQLALTVYTSTPHPHTPVKSGGQESVRRSSVAALCVVVSVMIRGKTWTDSPELFELN